jgi:hypothetical protein
MALAGLCQCIEEVSTVVTHPSSCPEGVWLGFLWRIGGTGVIPFIVPAVYVGSCLATMFQLLVMLSHVFHLILLILHL